jgi:hypothetical protein
MGGRAVAMERGSAHGVLGLGLAKRGQPSRAQLSAPGTIVESWDRQAQAGCGWPTGEPKNSVLVCWLGAASHVGRLLTGIDISTTSLDTSIFTSLTAARLQTDALAQRLFGGRDKRRRVPRKPHGGESTRGWRHRLENYSVASRAPAPSNGPPPSERL